MGTRCTDYGRGELRNFLIASAVFLVCGNASMVACASMRWPPLYTATGLLRANPAVKPQSASVWSQLGPSCSRRSSSRATYSNNLAHSHRGRESAAWPLVSRPTYIGGLGFRLQWNMGWMRCSGHGLGCVYRAYQSNITRFCSLATAENFVLPTFPDEGSSMAQNPLLPLRMPVTPGSASLQLTRFLLWLATGPSGKS